MYKHFNHRDQITPLFTKEKKLQNRFNNFRLEGPYSTSFEGSVHERRFLFYEQLWNENKQLYPHFIPPTTGIRLWKPEDFD